MVGWILFCILATSSVMSDVVPSASGGKKPVNDRHVIVVGGGLAGLSAAIEAVTNMARVTLIEGEKVTGGNSAKATSGINGCDTSAQRKLGIKDSHDKFFSDTVQAGHNENNMELVDALVHHAAESVEFLIKLGVDLTDVNIGGGHSVPRTHWIPSPKNGKPKQVGGEIMRAVYEHLKLLKDNLGLLDMSDRFNISLGSKAEELLYDSATRTVTGVRIRNAENEVTDLLADSVILATGGFCNDHSPTDSLLTEFVPQYANYPTTNGPFATGSGIKMARKVQASLIQMDIVQIHPTGFVDPANPTSSTKFLAAEALRGSGAILLNQDGRRFANELGTRDYLTAKILASCQFNETSQGHTAFMILNDACVDKFGWPSFNFYWKVKKFFQMANGLGELEQITKMPASNVEETFLEYDTATSGGSVEKFGKVHFPVAFFPDDKLYVAAITPVLHYTMGGLEINADAQVLSSVDKSPIGGLYAAGEITGGLHGANRLSGNSLLECVVFGRAAGKHATAE